MTERSGSRGASVLAALVLVGILGGVIGLVQLVTPDGSSYAQAGAVLGASTPWSQNPEDFEAESYIGTMDDSVPVGNALPHKPLSCTPQYVCESGMLYARNDVCVDEPIARCEYGCLGSACAPQPRF